MKSWNEIKEDIIAERGSGCEFCGQPGWDAHHALVTRQKRNRAQLDTKYNIVVVCREHHIHSQDAMRQAWGLLVARYGRDVMVDWVEGLDLLVKPRIAWLEDG